MVKRTLNAYLYKRKQYKTQTQSMCETKVARLDTDTYA